jgi:hypothetical protein
MNNVIHARQHIDNDGIDQGRPDSMNHDLCPQFTADSDMSRTPGGIALQPLREIGLVGRRLILERRQRDAAWDVVDEMFEQAYVCSLLDVEMFAAQPLENDDEIARTIDLIEEARGSGPDDLPSVYGRPCVYRKFDSA